MATTQVILKEKIKNLGAEGDVVKVKAGFARNFLLPQSKAFEATPANLRRKDALQKVRLEREAKELDEAGKLAAISALPRPLPRHAGAMAIPSDATWRFTGCFSRSMYRLPTTRPVSSTAIRLATSSVSERRNALRKERTPCPLYPTGRNSCEAA